MIGVIRAATGAVTTGARAVGNLLDQAARFSLEEAELYYKESWEAMGLTASSSSTSQQNRSLTRRILGFLPGVIGGVIIGGCWMWLQNTGHTLAATTKNAATALFSDTPDYAKPSLTMQRHFVGLIGHVLGAFTGAVMTPFALLRQTARQTLNGFKRGINIASNNPEVTIQEQLTPHAKTITEGFQKFVLGLPGQILGAAALTLTAIAVTTARVLDNVTRTLVRSSTQVLNASLAGEDQVALPEELSEDPNIAHRAVGKALGYIASVVPVILIAASVGLGRLISNTAKEIANACVIAWDTSASNDKDTRDKSLYKTGLTSTSFSSENSFYKWTGRLLSLPFAIPLGLLTAAAVTTGRVAHQISIGIMFGAATAWNTALTHGKPQPAVADKANAEEVADAPANPSEAADALSINYENYPGKGRWKQAEPNTPLNPIVHGVGLLVGGVFGSLIGIGVGVVAGVVRAAQNIDRSARTSFMTTLPLALHINNRRSWIAPKPPGWNAYAPFSAIAMIVGGGVGLLATLAIALGRSSFNAGKHLANGALKIVQYVLPDDRNADHSYKYRPNPQNYFSMENDWAGSENNPINFVSRVIGGLIGAIGLIPSAAARIVYNTAWTIGRTFIHGVKVSSATLPADSTDSFQKALFKTDDSPSAETKVYRAVGAVVGGLITAIPTLVASTVICISRGVGNLALGLFEGTADLTKAAWNGQYSHTEPKKENGALYRGAYYLGQVIGVLPGTALGICVIAARALHQVALGAWDSLSHWTAEAMGEKLSKPHNELQAPLLLTQGVPQVPSQHVSPEDTKLGSGYIAAHLVGQGFGIALSCIPVIAVAVARLVKHFVMGVYESTKTLANVALGNESSMASSDNTSGAGYRAAFRIGQIAGLLPGVLTNVLVTLTRAVGSIGNGAVYAIDALVRPTLPPSKQWKKEDGPRPKDNNHKYLGYAIGGLIGGVIGVVAGFISSTTQSFAAAAGASWNAALSAKHFNTLREDTRSTGAKVSGIVGYGLSVPIMAVATAVRIVRRAPDILLLGVAVAFSVLKAIPLLIAKANKHINPTPKAPEGAPLTVHTQIKTLRHSVDATGSLNQGAVIGAASDTWSRFKRQLIKKCLAFYQDSIAEETLKAYEKDYTAWQKAHTEGSLTQFLELSPQEENSEIAALYSRAAIQGPFDRTAEVQRRRTEITNVLTVAKDYLLSKQSSEEKPTASDPSAASTPSTAASRSSIQEGKIDIDTAPQSATSFWKVFVGEPATTTPGSAPRDAQ